MIRLSFAELTRLCSCELTMIEHFCVSLHCVYTVINEIITYLQKKPDVFHQVDSIIGYYIGYSNGIRLK